MASKEVGALRTRLSFEDEGATRSLKSFRDDLRSLRSEMNVAQSRGREYANSLKGLREQSDILTRRLEVQRRQVEELRRRYEESRRVKGENAQQTKNLANQYNNAVAAMNRTEQELKKVTQQIEQQINPWRRLSESAESAGKTLQTIGSGLTSFGRAWSMRVTAPIVGAGAAALKVGMDFEQGMSKVQALTGATAAEMQKLSEQAKELGATTRFTATQAADAMGFLGMAGWEVSEILAAMPGLLALAAAGALDLGRAADITSNIMQSFSIEAGRAGHVSDVLAHAMSSANTNLEQLGEAMKYAAPTANALGLSLEETTAAIMGVSDAGIQGSMAGRAFATSLARLAKPTAAMEKEMKKLGLSFFDTEGVMKPLPDIMADLEKATADLDEQTTSATLSTLFGAEAYKHWAVLLEQGSETLRKNTEALRNSEGAAQRMARTMSENTKGAIIEFKSALEGVGIALAEHMIPVITDFVKRGTELVRQFGELDDATQKNIIKWGLLAAAIGPVSVGLGGLTTTLGGLFRAVGTLSGAIAAKGGLVAALGALANPVTATIAGVGLLAGGIYLWNQRANEAKKVNFELADSLIEQANALEPNIERFEELQRKSRLTSDEFGRLLDVQTELNREQNPEKVEELQEAYDKLREKSGLSNDELKEMISLNDQIIDQTHGVVQSFTDQGNAVVESTEAVREYIQSLREMAFIELQGERIKALERERELRQENKELNEELVRIQEDMQRLIDAAKLSEEERLRRLAEIDEKMRSGLLTQEEYLELDRERADLLDVQEGRYQKAWEHLVKLRQETLQKLEANEAELAKLDEINARMADLLLAEVGLNYEKGEGLKQLDERIKKLQDEKAEVEALIQKEGDHGGVLQEQLDYLNEQIRKHERIRRQIEENTGLQTGHTREIDRQNKQVEATNRTLELVEQQMQRVRRTQAGTNEEIDSGTEKAREMTKELGKDVRKDVTVDDKGTAAKVHREAQKSATKTVTLRAVWTGVASGLRAALANIRFPGFAKGTNYAPGGPALVGEEGFELARYKDKWALLDFGIVNLPRGTQVFTHDESKKIIQALNKLPAFATGASYPGEADRIVNQLNRQSMGEGRVEALLVELIRAVREGKNIIMDDYLVGKIVEKHITEIQNRNRKVRERFAT